MKVIVWNIIDFIERFNEESVRKLISDFSTKRATDEAPIIKYMIK